VKVPHPSFVGPPASIAVHQFVPELAGRRVGNDGNPNEQTASPIRPDLRFTIRIAIRVCDLRARQDTTSMDQTNGVKHASFRLYRPCYTRHAPDHCGNGGTPATDRVPDRFCRGPRSWPLTRPCSIRPMPADRIRRWAEFPAPTISGSRRARICCISGKEPFHPLWHAAKVGSGRI
jgi:hypothetical protein